MKNLILIRHAATNAFEEEIDDHDKGINKKGKLELEHLFKWLLENKMKTELVYTSSAKRALLTTNFLFSESCNIINKNSLYLCDYIQIISLLKAIPSNINEVAIVGHEPSISETLDYLVGECRPDLQNILKKPYPTAGLSVIHLNINSWTKLEEKSGIFDAFVQPNNLDDYE